MTLAIPSRWTLFKLSAGAGAVLLAFASRSVFGIVNVRQDITVSAIAPMIPANQRIDITDHQLCGITSDA